MRFVTFIFLVFILFNCDDNQSKQKAKPIKPTKVEVKKTIDSIKTEVKIDSSKLTLEEKFLPLTDDNAMPFFREYAKENPENKVRIFTEYGNIDLKLYKNTKYHRANFIFLTKNKAFDGTQFHRVVKNFVIQGGNSDDGKVLRKRRKIGRYLLPPDVRHGNRHHRGVISIPSGEIENAYKLASPFEFFITLSNQYHLDGKYTAFGKVTKGYDVMRKIAQVETDGGDWPKRNVYIKKVEIID